MANYDYDEHEPNVWAARVRQGSAMLVIGWIMIGWAVMTGVFFWSSLAVGSSLWVVATVLLVVLGAALVGAGIHCRRRAVNTPEATRRRTDAA